MDRLITHLFISLYHSHVGGGILTEQNLSHSDKVGLFESFGLFRGCEDASVLITKKVIDNFPSSVVTCSPEILRNFVKRVEIRIENGLRGKGGYRPEMSKMDEDGRFSNIVIYLKKENACDFWYVHTTLVHELTHAWQDYNMLIKGSSLHKHAEQTGYYDVFGLKGLDDIQAQKVYLFLYYLDELERGAYIAEFNAYVSRFKNKEFPSITRAIEALKNTEYYKVANKLHEMSYQYTDLSMSKSEKDKILFYVNSYSNRNFKTFGKFALWAKRNSEKMLRKAETVIGKVACEKLNILRVYPSEDVHETLKHFDSIL